MQDIQEEEVENKFIRVTNQMIYEWRFEELINLINNKYPTFFSLNQNIFYIIMKFKFIKIILFQQNIRAAQDFYSQYLTSIMKKIYGNKSSLYNKKHFKYQYFLNQINNNNDKYLYFRQHFKPQIHLDKFFSILEKAFLKEQDQERNPVIFNVTKINNNPNKINDNCGKPLFKTERVNNLTYNNENMSEIEDELFKLNLGEAKKNIFNVYSTVNKNMNNKDNIYLNSANPSDIDTVSNNNNDEYNNCNSNEISHISNISSANRRREINNQLDSKKFLEKNECTSFCNKENYNFNNKIRRVNLCKKIVRKFKKYLKSNKKEMNYSFWNSFCRENYLPPFKLEDIEFKSFSKIYLNWLFSHEGGVDLYNDFIRNKGDEELNNIYNSYGVNDPEEKEYLKNFFKNFAIHFSNLKLNENENENMNNNNFNNSEINKDFKADFANNFFDNYVPSKEDNLSIGSINEFYHEERNLPRGFKTKHFGVFNKMKVNESSNSSMEKENDNFDCNIDFHSNMGKDYECDKNYDISKIENYHIDGFSINLNNNQKYENKWEHNSYPDINQFYDYNMNNNNINASFPHNFFYDDNIGNENENVNVYHYNKKYDNLQEED
jgi:hypothetical protein